MLLPPVPPTKFNTILNDREINLKQLYILTFNFLDLIDLNDSMSNLGVGNWDIEIFPGWSRS